MEWSELRDGKIIPVETISQKYNTSTQQFDYTINGEAVSEDKYNRKATELYNQTLDIQCSGSSAGTMQSILSETEKTMETIGCSVDDIDLSEYDKQKEIYKTYLNSGKWLNRKFREAHSSVGINDIEKKLYYDFDGDGTLEMWLKASNNQSVWPDTLSVFCTIKDGKVVELLKAEECGGEIGGNYVTMVYSEKDDQLYIGYFDHSRGFGGSYGALTAYSLRDGELCQSFSFSALSYNQGMSESKYMINGKTITQEEESKFAGYYRMFDLYTAEKLLYDLSPFTSVRDRLIALKVIK